MDPALLQKFRLQLAAWIDLRLISQRLPFQRLELCPKTLTELGRLEPDLILWINRDSQLAGSMILLPDSVDEQVLDEGVAMAKGLGLGHFTTWAARDVSIWELDSEEATLLESFQLPPANRITPDDFQHVLDELLERLKIITVTSAPATVNRSAHYYANLCLRNLQDLTPGLTDSARMAAGQTAADEWVELAPQEKAWMSLWRILFLLWQKRLPPGLQPERLDNAIRYALSDLTSGQLAWLEIQDGEPPLHEEEAVRLHHLAGRLRQLGWPENKEQALELILLLMHEASYRFGLAQLKLPWCLDAAVLWVNSQPPRLTGDYSLVAPRTYIAGWILKNALGGHPESDFYATGLSELPPDQALTSAVAVIKKTQKLNRKEHESLMLRLRKVWPNRRFELPRETPGWVWNTLYLAGLVSTEITLSLPEGWHRTAGVATLWDILSERYRLCEIVITATGEQSLRFASITGDFTPLRVHREQSVIEIPSEFLSMPQPGTTQVWLKASKELVSLVTERMRTGIRHVYPDGQDQREWGTFLYLHTRLGRYLWELCSDRKSLPEFKETEEAVSIFGVPIPPLEVLSDLSLLGSKDTQTLPDLELLEREFTTFFGFVPELPETILQIPVKEAKARRRENVPAEQIVATVFRDGIPNFPEYYLMNIYRPVLTHYDIPGPLVIAEEFFDRILLETNDKKHSITISGKIVAEALILASFSGKSSADLPEEEQTLLEIVQKYREDLHRLWKDLTRECRRFEPHRNAASKLARKIWKQHNLPPQDTLKG